MYPGWQTTQIEDQSEEAMKRSGSDNRIVTQTTAREAIEWVNVLARRMGCAGPPACEPATADAATGKREGGLCMSCEAVEWLERRRLLR